jgi:hypothetical protein
VAWSVVTRPKELGGVGITDLKTLGWDLRVRWMWLQKNSTRQALAVRTTFFLKDVGELCNILLRRNELEPVQHPPMYKLNFKLH